MIPAVRAACIVLLRYHHLLCATPRYSKRNFHGCTCCTGTPMTAVKSCVSRKLCVRITYRSSRSPSSSSSHRQDLAQRSRQSSKRPTTVNMIRTAKMPQGHPGHPSYCLLYTQYHLQHELLQRNILTSLLAWICSRQPPS